MPITKSAKKSLRVSQKKREINLKQEIALKKALKKIDKSNVNEVISLIDKAAKTKLIHKNKAARLKSRLAKKFGTPKTSKIKPSQKPSRRKPAAKSAKSIKKIVKKQVKA